MKKLITIVLALSATFLFADHEPEHAVVKKSDTTIEVVTTKVESAVTIHIDDLVRDENRLNKERDAILAEIQTRLDAIRDQITKAAAATVVPSANVAALVTENASYKLKEPFTK